MVLQTILGPFRWTKVNVLTLPPVQLLLGGSVLLHSQHVISALPMPPVQLLLGGSVLQSILGASRWTKVNVLTTFPAHDTSTRMLVLAVWV